MQRTLRVGQTMARRILIILGVTGGLCLMLLVSLLLLARYAFPNDVARQQLERILSERLAGTVRIASLEFDPLTGLEVHDLALSRSGARVLGLDRLTLRYDPWHLLHGRLLIEELALGRASVLVDLATPAVADDDATIAASPPLTEISSIPIVVDLRRILVDRSEVTVTQGGEVRLKLAGLAVDAGVSAGPGDARASGKVDIQQVAVELGSRVLALPVTIEFDLAADLSKQRLSVTALTLRSDPALTVAVSGSVEEILSAPTLDLSLQETRLDLEQILRVAGTLLPDTLADVQVAGILSPTARVSGRMGDFGFDGTADVHLEGSALRAILPALKASLEPTSLMLRATEIPIRSGRARSLRAEVGLSTAGIRVGEHALHEVGLQLVASTADSGPMTLRLSMDGRASVRPGSAAPRLSVPISIAIDASGHRETQVVSLHHAVARVGRLASVELQAELGAPQGRRGLRAFSVTALLDARTGELLSHLPPQQRRGVTVVKQGEPDRVRLEADGTLDAAFVPQTVEGQGTVTVSGLRATLADQGLSGILDRLRLGMQASYGAEARTLRGGLTGAIDMAALEQGGTMSAERVQVKVDAAVTARLAPDLSLRQLLTQPRMTITARRLRYRERGAELTLPELTLATAAQADLLQGVYRLDALDLAAGSLVTVAAKGHYHHGTRRFAADLSVPSVAVGAVTRHLSGPAVRAMADLHPEGRASLRLRASGAIPTAAEIESLAPPITAHATLELHDVSGAWYEQAVSGGDAALRLSFSPEADRRLQAQWRIRVRDLHLAGSGPLRRLRGAYADGDVTAEAFDSVVLTGVRVGAAGGGVTLDGAVDGLQAFLEQRQSPPLTRLAPLFVKLRATGDLMLGEVQELLGAAGLDGTGQVGVTLDLLKRSHGPLSLRLSLAPRGLTVSTGGTRVVELDGTMTLRKVLQWRPGLNGRAPEGLFSPLTVLPELRLGTPSRDELRIRAVEAAGLVISSLSAGLSFDRNRLLIQDLAMNLLEGGLGGSVLLDGGTSFKVTTRLEAAHLDVNRLLPEGERVRGDSIVDATLNLAAVFDSDQGRLDFGESSLELSVSRIGRDALDRLLLVLDPQGSNPSIVSARSAVSFANPAEVRVSLFKGLVGLQIEFQEGVLGRFEVDRIPVGKIKQVRNLTQAIPQWEAIREIMALVGAERYGVDGAGQLVLE